MSERHGDWIKTFTGKTIYPLDFRVEEVDIIDIAHSLSQICRFTGHTRTFYSVAQHSVLVAENLEFPSDFDFEKIESTKKMALLHDAQEAYIGDISRPLKRSLKSIFDFDNIEWLIQETIFNLFIPNWRKFKEEQVEKMFEIIKVSDNNLLYSEGEDLMEGGTKDWHDASGIKFLEDKIIPMSPKLAKLVFLNKFEQLFGIKV